MGLQRDNQQKDYFIKFSRSSEKRRRGLSVALLWSFSCLLLRVVTTFVLHCTFATFVKSLFNCDDCELFLWHLIFLKHHHLIWQHPAQVCLFCDQFVYIRVSDQGTGRCKLYAPPASAEQQAGAEGSETNKFWKQTFSKSFQTVNQGPAQTCHGSTGFFSPVLAQFKIKTTQWSYFFFKKTHQRWR